MSASADSSENELLYYLGWVDKRTDPWPNHEALPGPGADLCLGGRPVEFLPSDHREWPDVPYVRGAVPLAVGDGRMGHYAWPGLPLWASIRASRR